ncbi:PIN domain-containing protein [Curtobacterium aurantiacum]|uniref:VapC toxin family PIN domain ribonuclease n=1 Tax=Curtobacterium aurantiacum TaxID=3236919 RepID=A0ABS5VAB1_9MICO|nr:PIN domain-containing protein [Curtobacterium flaccumfaciens]MBT1544035.1 VapC toxin family PIN domain ribonuclease [Curtobacterium flaccumfaciens pv. flaccumfaciens]MBT1586402.1 VapC toxin family PIN domain ribonuclease [Curtobacterium flaccumfaciens pv. flaccumfaciens]
MSAYIVDNSVWWKARRFPGIAGRLRTVSTQDLILTCPPQVLEYCFSARDPAEHSELQQDMAVFFPADEHPTKDDALAIQTALWNGGYVRGAGTIDTLIAAYAIANDAIVLAADHDYDHIAAVVPEFLHEYLPEQ